MKNEKCRKKRRLRLISKDKIKKKNTTAKSVYLVETLIKASSAYKCNI